MESSRLVVTELSHIKDLVMQLQAHLDGSHDRCKHLASQIFSLTERSIGMITSSPGITSRLASETPSPFKSTKKKRWWTEHVPNEQNNIQQLFQAF
jgi:hypothetical protein